MIKQLVWGPAATREGSCFTQVSGKRRVKHSLALYSKVVGLHVLNVKNKTFFSMAAVCLSVCSAAETQQIRGLCMAPSAPIWVLQSQVFVFISTRINRLSRLFRDQDQVQLLARSRILDMFKYFHKEAQLASRFSFIFFSFFVLNLCGNLIPVPVQSWRTCKSNKVTTKTTLLLFPPFLFRFSFWMCERWYSHWKYNNNPLMCNWFFKRSIVNKAQLN